MGIYPDHGVEYLVYTSDNSKIVVASTRATDARLEKSDYYLSRKDQWFNSQGEFSKKITNPDFELTEKEQVQLDLLLAQGLVAEHGWYEVLTISTSY